MHDTSKCFLFFVRHRDYPLPTGKASRQAARGEASTTVVLRLGASPVVVRPRERYMPVNVAKLVDDNVLMGFEQGRPYSAFSEVGRV